MLTEMSPSELWVADYRISPWGEWRADWRVAQLTAAYHEVHRGKGRIKPFLPNDFMYDVLEEQAESEKQRPSLGARLRAALRGIGHKKKE